MEKKYRISWIIGGIMIGVALLYDGAQALIEFIMVGFGFTVNWVITVWAWLTFYTWFKIYGVSFLNARRGATLNSSFIIEIFPFLAVIPSWTLAVLLLVLSVRAEDFVAQVAPAVAAVAKTLGKTA